MRIAGFAERKRQLITGQNRGKHDRARMLDGGIEELAGIAFENPHGAVFGASNN